jgi:hypothetical protein
MKGSSFFASKDNYYYHDQALRCDEVLLFDEQDMMTREFAHFDDSVVRKLTYDYDGHIFLSTD